MREIQLDEFEIWVHVRGLPPHLLNKHMRNQIEDRIGRHVWTNEDKLRELVGSCLRIGVRLRLNSPLPRWINVRVGMVEVKKYDLEYERLPHFCFYCGLLSRFTSSCSEKKTNPNTEVCYGRWRTIIREVVNI